MKKAPDLYRTLGVSRDAPKTTIVAAYRAAAKATHPDAGGSKEAFQEVVVAYRVLRDYEMRAAYDADGTVERERVKTDAERVRDELLGLFNAYLSQGAAQRKDVSIIDSMKNAIAKRRDEIASVIATIKAEVADLKDLRRSIARVDDADNLFTREIDRRVDEFTARRKAEEGRLDTVKKVADELSCYTSFVRMQETVDDTVAAMMQQSFTQMQNSAFFTSSTTWR